MPLFKFSNQTKLAFLSKYQLWKRCISECYIFDHFLCLCGAVSARAVKTRRWLLLHIELLGIWDLSFWSPLTIHYLLFWKLFRLSSRLSKENGSRLNLCNLLFRPSLKFGAKTTKVSRGFQLSPNASHLALLDPIFISILTDIFENLASSPQEGIYETVVKQALPILSNAIMSAKKEESWIAGSAIDLVSSLVQGAPENRLGDGFFQLLAPSLFACLTTAEDRDVLQVTLYMS